jgi:hypothetical protein
MVGVFFLCFPPFCGGNCLTSAVFRVGGINARAVFLMAGIGF